MATAQAKLDELRWLRGLGDRVVQSAIAKGEKEDPWAKARLDALFAKFTAPALSEPEFVEQTLELEPRATAAGRFAGLIAADCRAAAVYRLRGTKTLVVVTAVQMGGSMYELRVHVRAPRNRTYLEQPNALVHARMTPEGSRRLLAQLVHVPAMHEQEHADLQGDDDLSINRHHPHVLSILTRMSELEKMLVQEAREHNPLPMRSPRTIDPRLVLVAFSPLPAGAEEVLCLVGHSAAFTRGDIFSVATPFPQHVEQLCDVLGRDYVKECGLVPTLACAKLVCERAALFSPTTGRNGVFDRLANFDVLIEAGEEERDVRRLVAEMAVARASAPADAHGALPQSAPSPTPSSVDDDEPRIAPPVIPSNQGKRPSSGAASGKTKAAAKKRAREENEDESEDEDEEESDEDDVSDGDGEDAAEEDEDEGEVSDEDESEEPAPPPKKAKAAAPAAAAPAAAAARSPAAPLVFACPDGVREVHTDCIYLKNVQMLAHIPVAINAPEGATEVRVVVQYYARANGHARGA